MPINNRWVSKQTVVYLYNGILLSSKKEYTVDIYITVWINIKILCFVKESRNYPPPHTQSQYMLYNPFQQTLENEN